MTDTELNEAVARKLGWAKQPNGQWNKSHPLCGEVVMFAGFPDYCNDIKAAWEIMESITKESERKQCGPVVSLTHDGQWHFRVGNTIEQADTAPRAICEAYLKLS